MKKNYLFLAQLFISLFIDAQTHWVRYSSNPVMTKANNLYEGTFIGSPSVIVDKDTLKMIYAAGGTDSKGRISYAYSLDGITWIKYNNAIPVLDVSMTGNWDSHFLDTPDWLRDSFGYKMYYFGDTDNISTGGSIGLATSLNGINWVRYGTQPVLASGNPGDWDGLFVADPSVLFDGTSYFMWYSGVDTTWQVKVGLAISPDGYTWTKYAGNPVLNGGSSLPNYSWEGFGVGIPTVLKRNNQFEMYYCGVSYYDVIDNGIVDTIKIGYATCIDGVHWTKDIQNPVFSTYDAGYTSTEYRGPWAPDAVYIPSENKYYIWYETCYGFGLATSTDNYLSINEVSLKSGSLYFYPNPSNGFLTIEFNDKTIRKGQIDIYNSMNAVVKEVEIKQSAQINITDLPSGLYLMTLKNYSERPQKLIKQ